MQYDIDFPVSRLWAEFYSAQGLSVDPAMVEPRRGNDEAARRFLAEVKKKARNDSIKKIARFERWSKHIRGVS